MATQRQPVTPALDQKKVEQFLHKFVNDLGAGMCAALALVGEKLGLYAAMSGAGPLTAAELAARTSTNERYVREWLAAQAANGYVEYDATSQRFYLPNEHALLLANEDGPAYIPGAFHVMASVFRDEHKISEAFRSGDGVGWHEHHPSLFEGTEKFFRPTYLHNLIDAWIPALDGVEEKLRQGAGVADVGCGHGASTILMAEAFPESSFYGFDYHQASIEKARQRAEKAGVQHRVKFEVATAKDFDDRQYDLVCFFDCLHDMGDPAGAVQHVRETLDDDGTLLIVEPYANESLVENLNPVGRVFYAASTMICTPASRAQEVGAALGAQAPESKLREVVNAGGFTRFRRAAETPFNRVYEARP
ncbi:MAG: class I SAM-dependent methyltransferase [Acidobacteriia bacterium]|nr:class I SAM-dependent methyltransferase [Terriglobia bacterium]